MARLSLVSGFFTKLCMRSVWKFSLGRPHLYQLVPSTKLSMYQLFRVISMAKIKDENTPEDDPRLEELDLLSALVEEYEKGWRSCL